MPVNLIGALDLDALILGDPGNGLDAFDRLKGIG
jgi:hypothetical protein